MTRKLIPLFVLIGLVLCVQQRVAHADLKDDLEEGDRYFNERNWKKAAAAYDRAIKSYPTQVEPAAYGKRAAIFFNQQDFDGGLAFIRDRAKKQYPNAPEVLEYEALILWQLDKKADAIAIAEKVAAAKKTAWTVQILLGDYYAPRDSGKTAAAYAAYLESRPAELEKQDVLPRIRLGLAYLDLARTALGDHDGKTAKADYTLAVSQFDILLRKHGKVGRAVTNANNGLCAGYTGLGKYDQAITVCEQIVRDPNKVDSNGSVWFNLGKAYFEKKQYARGRTAATEYTKKRPKEARGYILIGDAYFEERNYPLALEQYQRAEQLVRADQASLKVGLAIKQGKTYLRLPFNGTGANPNLQLAIDKLENGLEANPGDFTLSLELGRAYLLSKDDAKALATTDRLINGKAFDRQSDGTRVEVLSVAARALYNQAKLKDARVRFEAAFSIRPKDVNVKRGLVQTINFQAYQAFNKQDYKATAKLLDEAAEVDPTIPTTNLDRAVLAIAQGECGEGQKHLMKLNGVKGYELAYERLIARTYLCIEKPDRKKAAEHYAAAFTEVKKVQNNLIQAEIFTEWAPLIMDTNVDDAVSKLEDAVQFSAQEPRIRDAAKRNLAVALFKRGWKNLKDRKFSDAVSDFERANREPALLKGTESLAFEFSLAYAMLEKGGDSTSDAAKMFKSLAGKGNQSSYLKAPYSKVGTTFFAAYANYRGGNAAAKQAAAKDFAGLSAGSNASFAAKIKDLLASSWEYVAYDAWRNGKSGAAGKALTSAAKYAENDIKKRVSHNKAVLSMKSKDLSTFQDLGDTPPEALVNAGILLDQAGKAEEAYEAWKKAVAKGADGKDVKKWIDAKKRIYGFN